MNINAVIVEDSRLARNELKEFLKELDLYFLTPRSHFKIIYTMFFLGNWLSFYLTENLKSRKSSILDLS